MLREMAVALCLFTFLLTFVLWFIRYVRVEKNDPGGEDG
jgi:hypothetical protein